MDFLDQTCSTPAENLAADEALLDAAEAGERGESLRIWRAPAPFVVLGHSNRLESEVHPDACAALNIPILRRCSGGGTVLQGPGSLSYALILNIHAHPELDQITRANHFIMSRHARLLTEVLGKETRLEGFTDLVLEGRKISGNAQRRRRAFLLFHGTILLDPDLELMERLLRMPSRKPAYRGNRSHSDFLGRTPVNPGALTEAWRRAWGAASSRQQIPHARVSQLVRDKYGLASWNRKF
jgi:lipoate---protein ligase